MTLRFVSEGISAISSIATLSTLNSFSYCVGVTTSWVYDLNPGVPGTRWPITEQLVTEAVDFISVVREHVVQIVRIT